MKNHIAKQILRHRKRLKITQDQFAKEFGVSGLCVARKSVT